MSFFWAPAAEPAEPVSSNPTASISSRPPAGAVPATSVADSTTGSTGPGAASSDDVAAPMIGVLIEPASW